MMTEIIIECLAPVRIQSPDDLDTALLHRISVLRICHLQANRLVCAAYHVLHAMVLKCRRTSSPTAVPTQLLLK
jgi:hypothetical protein